MAQDNTAQTQFIQIQQASTQLVNLMNTIATLNDKFVQDSTLAARTATQAQASGYVLVTADYTNWGGAVVQMTTPYNTGSPTTKSFFYKML